MTKLNKIIKEKDEKIAELLNDKAELDKECEDVLSWGRSHEHNYNELIDKLASVLKDLAETKLRVIKVAIRNVNFLVGIVFILLLNFLLCSASCSNSTFLLFSRVYVKGWYLPWTK